MLFHRSEYAEIPLEPFGVVILNEILNHGNQAGPIGEAFSVIPFPLQNSPESFHRTVINTLGYSGHALRHTGFGQHTVESAVRVLESSVTVAERVGVRVCVNRYPERIKYQRIVIGVPNYIADDPSVIQIQNGTEIYLLYLNANVVLEFSNIRQPFLVGLVCFEFPVQQIVCQVIWILALSGTAAVVVFNRRFNPAVPTDPKHPFVIHMRIVVPIKFVFKPAISHFRMLFVNVLNQISNSFILSGSGSYFTC